MPDKKPAVISRDPDWSNKINETLLDIDQWFGLYGDTIPEHPRAEIENHLRRLSEHIHGYALFLGGSKPLTFDLPGDGDDGPDVASAQGIPVTPFGRDAELALRARQRRAGVHFGWWIVVVVIWAIIALSLVMLAQATRADERHDRHMAEYHSTPEEAEFFNNLKHPNGGGCCGENDCYRTEAAWRQRPDGTWGWEAIVVSINKGRVWATIPDGNVVDARSLDGEAYVCASEGSKGGVGYSPGGGGTYTIPPSEPTIFCFVPPELQN